MTEDDYDDNMKAAVEEMLQAITSRNGIVYAKFVCACFSMTSFSMHMADLVKMTAPDEASSKAGQGFVVQATNKVTSEFTQAFISALANFSVIHQFGKEGWNTDTVVATGNRLFENLQTDVQMLIDYQNKHNLRMEQMFPHKEGDK